MTTANKNQPAHFFDRVPAGDTGVLELARAYVRLNVATGRYELWDTVPPDNQVYVQVQGSGRFALDSTAFAARTPTIYDGGVVIL